MRILTALAASLWLASPAHAVTCGGDFGAFLDEVRAEALARGHAPEAVDRFLRGARQDASVLRADRRQGVFQLPFLEFSRRVISQNRLSNGRAMAERHDRIFDEIEARYGVSRGVLLAFWALETDYGQVLGDYNTRDALLTLAHDCRRPELFAPQIFAAMSLTAQGDFDPARTRGAWAGEIGQVQMLPDELLESGVDADGDGRVGLMTSVPDALHSGAAILRRLGWRANEPWLREITLPEDFDWRLTGLDRGRTVDEWQALGVRARQETLAGDLSASVILPQGRGGPAFLAYPNFRVLFEWNKSFVYVATAAYFATRLEGAPIYLAGDPAPALSGDEMIRLQEKLVARGHDVGGIDGILGERTRAAVQAEQARLGLPADAWPTPALLDSL